MGMLEIFIKYKNNEISLEDAINNIKNNNPSIIDVFNEGSIIPKIESDVKNIIDKNESIIKKSGENFSQVEYFGRMLLLNFFWTNGLFVKSNKSITKSEIKKKINLDSKFDNLFEILLIILEKEKFVNINGEIITSTDKVESPDLKKELDNLHKFKEKLTSKYNDMTPHFNLLEICISNYPAILSGEKSPDGVMFPVYSMELVEGVFRNNILADYFNKLIATMVSSYLKNLSDKKVKILEIGAGSGGTSVFVLEEINKYKNTEYYFTDISKVFTRGAEKKFKEKYPFTHFKKLDIENEIESQGFQYENFDIILGSNVVHSTKNIDYTLSQIKKLLSPSGLFILNEVTAVQDFTSLTFGLLGGWWLFSDAKIRLPNSPLLDIDNWKKSLQKNGFSNINLISTSHQDKPDSFSQSLFVSQNNITNPTDSYIKMSLEKFKNGETTNDKINIK